MTGALDFAAHMRAAYRQRLLGMSMPDVTLTAALAASGNTLTTTQVGLDFIALGFRVGDFVMTSGFTQAANKALNRITALEAKKITVDDALASESKVVRVYVPLPAIAYEAETFEPNKKAPHLAEVVRTVSSQPSVMGGIIAHTVLATATLFYPAGQGTIGIESMAGRLLQRFAPGAVLSYGGDAGKVFKCEPSPLLQEPEWISQSVTASVAAWTLN